jgi:voltage-gated potassium channel
MVKQIIKFLIDDELHHPIITRGYRFFLVLSIFYIIFYTILDTKYSLDNLYGGIFLLLLQFSFFGLFIDFILRVVGAYFGYNVALSYIHQKKYSSIWYYLFSFYGLVDFVSATSIFLYYFQIDKDILLIISMISLLKIARFTPALNILIDVVQSESKTLLASLYVMLILTISTSTMIYFIEKDVNSGFNSLVDALWWSVITLSTVGYGDVVPQTQLGKLLGGLSAISGFGMFALPAGILANGFANEIKRIKEMASLEIISKVPLFSSLDESAIFDIANILRVKRFRKGEIIIRENSQGDAMYFIVKGSVSVIKKDFLKVLLKGDFFGEIALLRDTPRTATIKANEKCELLELSRYDFKNLISSKPELLKEIEKVAKQRY